MYFHQIEGVEFIHGQTFLTTLYICTYDMLPSLLKPRSSSRPWSRFRTSRVPRTRQSDLVNYDSGNLANLGNVPCSFKRDPCQGFARPFQRFVLSSVDSRPRGVKRRASVAFLNEFLKNRYNCNFSAFIYYLFICLSTHWEECSVLENRRITRACSEMYKLGEI